MATQLHSFCIKENDGHSLCLEFETRDGRVYGFPYVHLLNYLLEKKEENSDAGNNHPPERLSLWFSTHDVVVVGWRLDGLRFLLREGKVACVTAQEPRYANLNTQKPFVTEIVINEIKSSQLE